MGVCLVESPFEQERYFCSQDLMDAMYSYLQWLSCDPHSPPRRVSIMSKTMFMEFLEERPKSP